MGNSISKIEFQTSYIIFSHAHIILSLSGLFLYKNKDNFDYRN